MKMCAAAVGAIHPRANCRMSCEAGTPGAATKISEWAGRNSSRGAGAHSFEGRAGHFHRGYTPGNVRLTRHSAGWRLSGLIDFGDVMTGWGEYDLLGPSAFVASGLPGRLRSLFRGFGYSQADLNATLTHRLMALFLLHRFSNPFRQICIADWQERADDLRELELLLWPI
jgi:Ser/Thr protein kinase RdoA (MazF antagonist)